MGCHHDGFLPTFCGTKTSASSAQPRMRCSSTTLSSSSMASESFKHHEVEPSVGLCQEGADCASTTVEVAEIKQTNIQSALATLLQTDYTATSLACCSLLFLPHDSAIRSTAVHPALRCWRCRTRFGDILLVVPAREIVASELADLRHENQHRHNPDDLCAGPDYFVRGVGARVRAASWLSHLCRFVAEVVELHLLSLCP